MTKKKVPQPPEQNEVGHAHPQIEITDISDLMSSQRRVNVTIPPVGGDLAGVLEAISDGFGPPALSDYTALKKLVDYDDFERAEGLHPKHNNGTSQVDDAQPLSERDFKRRAYLTLKSVEQELAELGADPEGQILKAFAPSLVRVGLILGELKARKGHYGDVRWGRGSRTHMEERQNLNTGKLAKTTDAKLIFMDEKILEGKNVSEAARLAAKKFEEVNENSGEPKKPGAYRQLYIRHKKKL